MIPSIKKILYVSDIGEGSRPAFRMAVSLAEQYDAKITFLHVIEPIPDSVRVTLESTLSADAYSLLQSDGAANLKQIISDRIEAFCSSELENSTYKPAFDTVLAEGIIHRKIIDVAEKMNADMVVMGTRTHSATKQFFMGSTANKVMRHSDVPVLVVPLSS
ncbi:MAG: nucleotide-binding universal stress UspA family protein [Oceanospirillaceae bacterium]|jgi:nucleotide-binding universal stress UspA family protein